MFMKSPAAVIAAGEAIRLPVGRTQIDWECELGVVIGRTANHVSIERAGDFIFGYTLENDVSDRGGRGDTRHGSDWLLGKNHDTFAPMGPFITPKEFVPNPQNMPVKFTLNGQVMQDANTSLMIHTIVEQVSLRFTHHYASAGGRHCDREPRRGWLGAKTADLLQARRRCGVHLRGYRYADESDRGADKMIALRNLEKSIKTGAGETFLLRRITFDVKPGEFISIMGPSGAGKSTLLHILGMHDTDWRGEYELHDQPIQSMKQKDRLALQKKHIGFVFQSYHLLDNLTVYENLEVPLSYRDVPRSQRQSIVSDVLDRFQIVAKKDLYPSQLSGGQQQLVGVARAVVANPSLILADEPTGNLHSDQAREIMELFKKLNNEGTTIIQVTHSETNAQYGNRIIKLRDGWIVND